MEVDPSKYNEDTAIGRLLATKERRLTELMGVLSDLKSHAEQIPQSQWPYPDDVEALLSQADQVLAGDVSGVLKENRALKRQVRRYRKALVNVRNSSTQLQIRTLADDALTDE